ncbi:hypothetical protein [Brevibacillus sp. NRS-1366]|uniref:hypothetical protein n=1 Tax=Brevibacillus sp. NRS-1366 TaxID=3233899 RepID=UPI003D1D1A0D
MASKKHKITSKFLDQLDKELEKKRVIHIETVKGTAEITIDEYFGELKIKKIISDLMEAMKPLLESEDITPDDLVTPAALLPVFIMREFTDLPIPQENDLAILSAVSERLDNHGFVRQVFTQLNQVEIDKLNKIVGDSFKNLPQIQRMIQELYAKFYLQQMTKEEVEEVGDIQESE